MQQLLLMCICVLVCNQKIITISKIQKNRNFCTLLKHILSLLESPGATLLKDEDMLTQFYILFYISKF